MKKMKKIALLLAVVILFGVAVGGTLAWLTDKTDAVTNTFTTSDVDITLTETDADEDGNELTNSYQMIPGYTITKDPLVTVLADSEKCYLYVKVVKSANFEQYMTYAMETGWNILTEDETKIEGVDVSNVFYRVVEKNSTEDQKFKVIADDKVTVLDTVTKDMMNALNAEGATEPTLTVTAYAHQVNKSNSAEFTAYQAWASLNGKTITN